MTSGGLQIEAACDVRRTPDRSYSDIKRALCNIIVL